MDKYRKLANAVFYFHMFWIVVLIGGAFLATYYPWYRPINFAVLTVTIGSQLIWMGCPLTIIEYSLRSKYDPDHRYTGSFVCYLLDRTFGIKVTPIMVIGQLAILTIVAIVFWLK